MSQEQNNQYKPISNAAASIRHFHEGLASGKNWYLSLLEAIGMWTDEFENIRGLCYQYVIEGEAFDWLLLAERLCDTADRQIPEKEKNDLFFRNIPPLHLTQDEFKILIGPQKYTQYLNYFYGITVEQALIQAVREEIRKERLANGWKHLRDEDNEAYTRIYGEAETSMLKLFRKLKHYHLQSSSNLTEMKEFTYWCFKYRVRTSEKARVASDTNKGLDWLRRNNSSLLLY